tara:strand:+ start:226 stop:1488 length:1263 start_codon:yes stop_codon:yes gene_type:complete
MSREALTYLEKFPKDWNLKTLDEVCYRIWIGLVTTMTKFYVKKGVKLIRNSDIRENMIDIKNLIELDQEFSKKHDKYLVKTDDVVTVHTGDVGTSCVISKDISPAQGFATINSRLNKKIMFPEFYSYYLNSEFFKKQTHNVITGDGRNNLNLKDFIKLKIIVPTLAEQKKFVEILKEFDNLISRLLIRIQKYQNLLKAIQENELQVLRKEQINQVELKSKNVISLGELFEFRNGLNYSKLNSGKGLKVLGVGDFKDNLVPIYDLLNEISPKEINYEQSLLKEGDFVFVRSNGNRNLIGRCLSIENIPNQEIAHSGFTIRARLKDMQKNNILFLKSILQSPAFRRSVSSMGGGTNISNLSQEILNDTLVILPNLDMQDFVSNKISTFQNIIHHSEDQLVTIKNLKQALLQDLLSGSKGVNI